MKKLSTAFVLLLALLIQVRVAYACEMMASASTERCCCDQVESVQAQPPTSSPCCSVQFTASDMLGVDAKNVSHASNPAFDPLAPPPALLQPFPVKTARTVSTRGLSLPPPVSAGTDTYLVTARLRI